MLSKIHIENFALIDQLELDLHSGLTIITGETGAGKSILLGALALVRGKRADLSVIRDNSKKCIVEAQFQVVGLDIKSLFDQHDLDYEEVCIMRREITPAGKSRAFINDTPVNLQIMSTFGDRLIDIHSQHQTLELGNDRFQLDFLQSFVDFKTIDISTSSVQLLATYRCGYQEYKQAQKRLEELKEKAAQYQREADYNQFLFTELEEAQLDGVQIEELEEEFEQLNNVELIQESIQEVEQLITADDLGVVEQLLVVKNRMDHIQAFGKEFEDASQRISSVMVELEDLLFTLSRKRDQIDPNPQRLQELQEQLKMIENLLQKHHKQEVEELIVLRDQLGELVYEGAHINDAITKAEKELAMKQEELESLSDQLSEYRKQYAPELSHKIGEMVAQLGMPNAILEIEVTQQVNLNKEGRDQVQFLFTANKGSDIQPLYKVASGGELSRLMLVVKALLAQYSKLPTIIFDEVDTGVSGAIAQKMAEIMRGMSVAMQVIAITHLPQIAAAGNAHLKVEKRDVSGVTVSQLKRLSAQERLEEIAQMLSGGDVTDAARENAKVLLQ